MGAPTENTNASHRKKLAREALRLRIDGEKSIDELLSIRDELKTPEANVPALKARADIEFGLLKKILPDLKSVEVSGEGGGPVLTVGRIELVALDDNSADSAPTEA